MRFHALVLASALAAPLAAQVPDSAAAADSAAGGARRARDAAREEVLRGAHAVRWYEAAGVAGAVAILMTVDEPVHRYVQRHRSRTLGDVASVFRHEGEPIYYAGVSFGVLAAGVIADDPDVTRAGGRLVASVGLSGVAMQGVKMLVGRSRPNEGVGAFSFHPFTGLADSAGIEARGSFPSGHTTAAFAVATTLADDIDSPVADVLLYTLATGAGWSRLYENRHWLSDVAMGAALGVTSAKLVSGRWRIFRLRPPGFLVTPTGAPALTWAVPLPPLR